MGAGHPVTVWTETRCTEIAELFLQYINDSAIPILSEFAYQNKIRRQTLYEYEEKNQAISDALEYFRAKKEAQLEKGGLSGDLNTTMSIFSLKQMGWTDKPAIEEATDPIEAFKAIIETVMNRD